MITVQLQDVESADSFSAEGKTWVTLRFAGGDRVVIHTVNFTQAVAIADAINGEAEARLSTGGA